MGTDLNTLEAPPDAYTFAAGPCAFATQAVNADGNIPLTLDARSDGPIEHWFWGRIVHDFAGMRHKDSIPVDYRHDDGEPIGYVDRFDANGRLVLRGELTPFTDGDRANEIVNKSKRGVPYEASIDWRGPARFEELQSGTSAEVNGHKVEGPVLIVREWVLRGVAVCLYGADSSTETRFYLGLPSRHPFAERTQPQETYSMSTNTQTPPPGNAVEDALAQLNEYLDAFGADGAKLFQDGTPFVDAMTAHRDRLAEELTEAAKTQADTAKQLADKEGECARLAQDLANRDAMVKQLTADKDRLQQAVDAMSASEALTSPPVNDPPPGQTDADPPAGQRPKPKQTGAQRFAAGITLPGRPPKTETPPGTPHPG